MMKKETTKTLDEKQLEQVAGGFSSVVPPLGGQQDEESTGPNIEPIDWDDNCGPC